jgi:hypothetical protein
MKRQTHQTYAAATFATLAELSKRGFDVSMTIGNTPRTDILCSLPNASALKIEIKGISTANGFYIKKDFFELPEDSRRFLIVVLVPKEDDEFRYFILSHREAKHEFDKMPKTRKDGRPYEEGNGLNWGSITNYENLWGTLKQPSSNKTE